MKKVDKFHLS